MVTEPRFLLTTKDHAILQAMLERHRGPHGPFAQLLERKVRASAISFRDDIPPGVVTLNSRVTYWVDGLLAGPHVVVQSEGPDIPDYALSIHTIRGLALLGLPERGSVAVDLGNGVTEELRVEAVLSQPEAEARMRQSVRGRATADAGDGTVVRFRPRQAPAVPGSPGPDDDDPGPRAA